MESEKENIGDRLKRMREKQNLSVKFVAESLRVGTTTYREWEYGRSISGEPYIELAKLFDVSLYELLTGEKREAGKELDEITERLKRIRLYCE